MGFGLVVFGEFIFQDFLEVDHVFDDHVGLIEALGRVDERSVDAFVFVGELSVIFAEGLGDGVFEIDAELVDVFDGDKSVFYDSLAFVSPESVGLLDASFELGVLGKHDSLANFGEVS